MMIDGSWWESGLTAWWCCWGRWDVMEHLDLSHCTWLQRVGMIRDGDFMRRWWVAYDDGMRWLSEDIDDYHRALVGAFTRFQRSRLWTRIFHVRPHSIGETRFLFVKNWFLKKGWSRHLFYFYFEGKIKQERKTLKSDSIVLEKACLWETRV